MMGDGKALQMGTSHELGQNFAEVFGIEFLDDAGAQQTAWTTSWGVSTRMVGGLIMAHGDDDGLRVPPRLAPMQVVVIVVRDEGDVVDALPRDRRRAARRGCARRARRQADVLARAPRHRLGAQGCAGAARGRSARPRRRRRRHWRGASPATRRARRVPLAGVVEAVIVELDRQQAALLDEAIALRESRTVAVATLDTRARGGRDGLGADPVVGRRYRGRGRARAGRRVTVRCLTRADGSLPDADDEPDLVAFVARSY